MYFRSQWNGKTELTNELPVLRSYHANKKCSVCNVVSSE